MRLTALCVLSALLAAAPARTAPTPKPTADTRHEAFADQPVEPAIDPEEAAKSAALKIRDAAHRAGSSNNLKQIGLAVHSYYDVNSRMPADVTDKDGKPTLSWRVLLLPYLEQQQLYQQFKLDEPWDSENNLRLLERMPKVFESPRVTVKKKGFTVYQGFSGPGAVFDPIMRKPRTFAQITDGLSNTILAVESSTAVPWTKPGGIPFDPRKDVPDFGRAYGGQPQAVMCDGAVRVVNLKKVKPETLRNAVNIADGNALGKDWD